LNIFLDKNNEIKLGDLGVSRIISNTTKIKDIRVGTPLYLSPEVIKHQPYNFKVYFPYLIYYLG